VRKIHVRMKKRPGGTCCPFCGAETLSFLHISLFLDTGNDDVCRWDICARCVARGGDFLAERALVVARRIETTTIPELRAEIADLRSLAHSLRSDPPTLPDKRKLQRAEKRANPLCGSG
jgi:hypothetical protein